MLVLEQRFPGLGEHLDRKMAFAVNGEIHQDAWFAPLDEGAEVVVLPKIGGG
jgi:molybdopterin converting factor small subunit